MVLTLIVGLASCLVTLAEQVPVAADGPAPCSSGTPGFAFHGSCATYNGANTYYGSYGPGFPTPLGWALCAWAPATGGWYPAPSYGYVLGDQPPAIDASGLSALGYAFSQWSVDGLWNGALAWSADDAAVAAKLLYDSAAWHVPVPSVSAGIHNALDALYATALSAVGATGAPQLTVALLGGASSFVGTTVATIRLSFPGTGAPAPGVLSADQITASYLNLITTEHQGAPRFVATVALAVSPDTTRLVVGTADGAIRSGRLA